MVEGIHWEVESICRLQWYREIC
uniref:Uncharacterized protein n=1 Tax=Anguilla anguilla TaxID=7936 RepID=A0A0E9T133_ANGAN